ncbi:MAG TPA: hypothetical protein VNT23_00740, partial [Gaiellaceae bacterium]|nr:hypothetical protein [Gaiellaceae bacterium]
VGIWCFGFVAAGYFAGSNWEHVDERLGVIDYVVAALLAAGVVYLVWRARRRRRAAVEPG